MEVWELRRWLGETVGVFLCPVSLGAWAGRGRFVPAALDVVVGGCLRNWAVGLILALVTPHNVNPSCAELSLRSERGHLVVGMC